MQSDGHVIPLWSIAREAPPEEKLGKSQQRAVRGFEPPPAASHDGELATGPKARPRSVSELVIVIAVLY